MARPRLSVAAALLAFGAGACDRMPHQFPHWNPFRAVPSSVTIKLPPARPAAPAPGFAFAPEGVQR